MTSYDWGRPGATALVVPFPEAEAVMGDFRRAHTPSGRDGMPAHATIIAPFIHASSISLPESATIRDTLRRFVAFDVSLEAFGCFEHIGCLYLEPDPSEPFVGITEALLAIHPEIDYPPEGLENVPHVTVGGHLTEEQQQEIKRALAPHLPVHTRAKRVVLAERGEDGRWFDREVFPL